MSEEPAEIILKRNREMFPWTRSLCAVTSVVIIIPSVDAIMEILAETVSRAHSRRPSTPQRREGCQQCKVLETDESEALTLKYVWEFIALSDAGSGSVFMHIYSALFRCS